MTNILYLLVTLHAVRYALIMHHYYLQYALVCIYSSISQYLLLSFLVCLCLCMYRSVVTANTVLLITKYFDIRIADEHILLQSLSRYVMLLYI